MTRHALLIVVALAVTAGVRAQQTQQAPVFRSSVDVVQVDVSVLDKDGHPVRGLTAGDFTLLENNKPQEIVAFAPVNVPDAPAQSAKWLRDTPPDVRTNNLGDGRLFALIMDDATMPPDLRMARTAREIARDVVNRLGPDDLAAVIYVSDTRRSVDFTSDRGRLLEAIEAFGPGLAYSDQISSTDNQLFFSSIRTLGLVAGNLAKVPQRRKAIIYVSTGAPVEASAVASIGKIGFHGVPAFDQPIPGSSMDEGMSRELVEAVMELVQDRPQEAYGAAVQDAFIRAERGNVNIYCVDPSGVGGMQAFFQQRVRTTDRLGGPLMTPAEAVTQARLHRDFLETVAEGSGGRAILATNDLQKGLTRIFEENSTYYLLGYQPSRNSGDRTVRRVTVRVSRPGLAAHTRNAYLGNRAAVLPASGPGLTATLTNTLSGILPNPDVTLRATAAAFRLPGGRAGLALATGVEQRAVGDAGARVPEQLDVLATAFSPDGKPRGTARQTARVALRAGLADASAYEVLSRIDLDPGRYQIRLAAHSTMTGKTGSVYFDIDVPDFQRAPLQLSGLVLSVTPVVAAAPTDAAEAFLPIVPTSRRTFSPADAVIGFLRIYEGAGRAPASADITVTITDATDHVVTKSAQPIASDTFVDRQADCKFTIPVTTLANGDYLITVEATQGGRSVKRTTRITIAGAAASSK